MVQTSAEGLHPSRLATVAAKMLPFIFVLGLFFVTTFNLQPEPLRLGSTLFFGGYLALAAVALVGHKTSGLALGAIAFSGFIALNLIHIVGFERYETAYNFSQYLFSFLASAILFMPKSLKLTQRSLGLLYLVILVLFGMAVFQAYYFNPVVVGTERLASFNGGESTLHPSAYAILAYLTFFALVNQGLEPVLRIVNYAAIAVGLVTLELYGVRTAHIAIIVAAFVFFALTVGNYYRFPLGNMIVLLVALVIPTIVVGVLYVASSVDDFSRLLMSYSSGRTAAYLDRFEIFFNRGLFEQLIGLGGGSDLLVGTNAWTWTAKDSHNDFLSFLLEYGVIGFLLLVTWFISLILSSRSIRDISIFSGLIVASAISNGVLLRPTLFFLFALAIVIGRSVERRSPARPARRQNRAMQYVAMRTRP